MIPASPDHPGQRLENRICAEQLAMLTRNRADQFVGIFTAGITAHFLWPVLPHLPLELWFGVSCLAVLSRACLAIRHQAAAPGAGSIRRWARLLTFGTIVTGLLWGSTGAAILLCPTPNVIFFVIFMTGGMTAGGAIGNAAYRPAMLGFALGAELPVIAALLVHPGAEHAVFAALLCFYTLLVLNACWKVNRAFADNIQMRFDQEQRLAQAQSSEAAMADAQHLPKTGSWTLDLETQILTLSPEARQIFGIGPEDAAPHVSAVMARVHPGDKALVEANAAALFNGSALDGFDYRCVMDDGAIKRLHISPKTMLNGAGAPTLASFSVQDVTAGRLAEERLLLSNLLLETQMEASPDGIQVSDAQRNMISFNQHFAEIWRVPPAEMRTGNDAFLRAHMIAQVKSPESYAARIQYLINHPDEAGEDDVLLADGRTLERHTRPLCTADGRYLGRVWFFRDITARQRAAQELEFAKILLENQMESSRDGIVVLDAGGKIIAVNRRYGEVSGTRVDDLLGQDHSVKIDRVRPMLKDPDSFLRRAAYLAAHPGEVDDEELEMLDGRFVNCYRTPLRAANGEDLGSATFYSDITERRQTEKILAYRDRLLHTVTAATAVAVSALSLADGVNAALAKIGDIMAVDRILVFRNEPDEARPLSVIFSWESAAVRRPFALVGPGRDAIDGPALAAFRRPLEDGVPVIAHRATAQGAVRAALEHHGTESVLLMPVFLSGRIWGFLAIDSCTGPRDWAAIEIETVGILADIAGSLIVRERARVALETSEQRFRLLTSTARDAVALTSEAGIILLWNQSAEQMFGFTAAEALGKDIVSLLVPRGRKQEIGRILQTVTETAGLSLELSLRRKDGGEIAVEISVSAARIGGRLEFIAITRDISERKIAAERLQFANILLETQMEASPDGILVVDSAGKITAVNHRYAEVSRTRIDDLHGRDFSVTFDRLSSAVKDPAAFLRGVSFRAGNTETNAGEEFEMADGRFISRYMTPLTAANGDYLGRAAFYTDITERKTAAQKQQFTNTLLSTQMEASPDGILVVDANRNMVSCNKRFADIWRLPAKLLKPGSDEDARRNHILSQVVSPETYAARINDLAEHPEAVGEDEILTTDGRTLERFSQSLISPEGEYLGRVWFFGDVTQRKLAERKLMLSNALLKTQLEASPDGIYVVGKSREVLSYNKRFLDMWSLSERELLSAARGWLRLEVGKQLKDPDYFVNQIAELNQNPAETSDDVLETIDGRIIEQHSVSLREQGLDLGRAWFYRDITARRAAEALALRHARYDVLTGLANRAVFVAAVQQAITHARRDGVGFAVLFLDLDHFKDVNDTLGHPAGDALLKAVAARLLGATRETDTVGRFGGDEFAVILSGIQDAGHAGTLAEKLIAAINIPLAIGLNTVHVRASIGIELFSASADDCETLLSHADLALYRAKAEGRGTFRFFTAEMDRDVRSRVTLGAELREALAAGQLFLLYQPQIVAGTGAIAGVEALIRWRHPARGLLMPEAFIEAAETTGAITQLGHFVLWTVCRQAAAWMAAGHAPPRISFNVSPLQFKSARTLEADIMAALAETGMPAAMLELELTEAALMSTSQENSDVLRRLKQHGVKFAIDDFGTGYSSLEHLRRFPADHIKIARAFTGNVTTDASDGAIVRAIIALARELKIATIAEGIETPAQLDLITGWGCCQMQGFYLARPLAAEKVAVLLKTGSRLICEAPWPGFDPAGPPPGDRPPADAHANSGQRQLTTEN